MLKRFFLLLTGLFLLGSIAGSSCIELSFDDADICLDIDKQDSNTFEVDTVLDNTNGTISIKCDLLLPDNSLVDVSANDCNTTFDFDEDSEGKIKAYIRVNNEYKSFEEIYDFDNGDWAGSSSNGDLDEFDFDYVEDTTPDTNEWITIEIHALDSDNDIIDDYDDKVTLHFERDGDDADDNDLQIDSDDFSDDEYDLDNGELEVYFDNGYLEFDVWFEYEDEYTITVDDGDIDEYQDFDVGGTSSDGDLDEFDFYYVEDKTPDTDERITIKIKALDSDGDLIDNYDDRVTLYFEEDGNDADDNDLQIDSNDFSDDEYDLDNGELEVYFDNGYLEFDVWFENEDDYSIVVADGSVDKTQDFTVGGSNTEEDLDAFNIYYVESYSPDKDERNTVKIKAEDRYGDVIDTYNEQVTLHFERDGDDADDYDLKLQSDDFNEDESDIDSNGELDVDFIDGYLEFEVWFEYEDDYTITIEDGDIDEYQDFNVGGSVSNDLDEFDFYYVEDKTPSKDERITVKVKALDNDGDLISDYDESVTLYFERGYSAADENDIQFKSDDSNEDEYDLDDGELTAYFDNGYLEFDVRFEYESEYTITVDDAGVEEYQSFDVGGSSSNGDLDDFTFYYVEDRTPDKDERITIKIKALDEDNDLIDDYDEEVTLHFDRDGDDADDYDLKIQSDDFNEDENDIDNNGDLDVNFKDGYLIFDVRFEYEDDYTITVEDGSIDKDQDFGVGDSSTNDEIDGFDEDEYETVQRFHTAWPVLIDRLEDQYYKLKYDNDRQDLSDELYDNMEEVLDDDSGREYEDYEDFVSAIWDRYYETISSR